MAFKKVVDLDANTCVGFGDKKGQIPAGKSVQGYYIGSRPVKTEMGPSVLHVLQTDKGNLGVWGSAQLNAKLASIEPGTLTRITYLKKIKVAKGTMKKFDVEFDEDERIEVAGTQVNFNSGEEPEAEESEGNEEQEAGAEETGEGEAEESESEESEEGEAETEAEPEQAPPPRKTAPPAKKPGASVSPENRARVAQLLGKKS